jgi:hypothetical protein
MEEGKINQQGIFGGSLNRMAKELNFDHIAFSFDEFNANKLSEGKERRPTTQLYSTWRKGTMSRILTFHN